MAIKTINIKLSYYTSKQCNTKCTHMTVIIIFLNLKPLRQLLKTPLPLRILAMVSESIINNQYIIYINHGIWFSQTVILKQNYAETLLQKIKSPRKRFSLILKFNHMLYKHDIEDRSDTIVGKFWFLYLIQKHTQRKQQKKTDLLQS